MYLNKIFFKKEYKCIHIFAIQGISNPDINTPVQVLNTVCEKLYSNAFWR